MLDIFEHSRHFADELLRYPELLEEIGGARGPAEPSRSTTPRPCGAIYRRADAAHSEREHVRPRADFRYPEQTSALADCVIEAAYRIAVAQAPPPARRRLQAGRTR